MIDGWYQGAEDRLEYAPAYSNLCMVCAPPHPRAAMVPHIAWHAQGFSPQTHAGVLLYVANIACMVADSCLVDFVLVYAESAV